MKKVLLATSALVAFAGAAHADVSIGGYARGGVIVTDGDSAVHQRVQLTFSGSVQTDSGIALAAKTRARMTGGTGSFNNGQVSMSANGLTLQLGNIDGPLDAHVGTGATVGFTGGSLQSYTSGDLLAYSSTGTGAQGAQISYSMGDFSVHVAMAESIAVAAVTANAATGTAAAAARTATNVTQVAVSYAVNGLSFAAGVQAGDAAADDVTAVNVGYSMNGIGVNYIYNDTNGKESHTLALNGSVGAATKANMYMTELDGAANTAFGVGINHDLGGASFGAAYERLFNGTDRLEAGISFSF
jgi:outer membrane protein OmpU